MEQFNSLNLWNQVGKVRGSSFSNLEDWERKEVSRDLEFKSRLDKCDRWGGHTEISVAIVEDDQGGPGWKITVHDEDGVEHIALIIPKQSGTPIGLFTKLPVTIVSGD